MPFNKEKAAIRGMVLAGNYSWAILALMELLEVTELHCREQGLKDTVESMESGRLKEVIRQAWD